MKVLYILNAKIMGGATISLFNMLDMLKEDVTPVLVAPKSGLMDDTFKSYVDNNHIRLYTIPVCVHAIYRPKNFLQFLRWPVSRVLMCLRHFVSMAMLERIVEKENPDLIHTNVGVIWEGLEVAKKKSIPHVWHVREYQDKDFNWMIIPSKQSYINHLLSSDAVVTISNGIRRHFRLDGCCKAETVFNGIYSSAECRMEMPKDDYFLCASRIMPEKGHEDVIRAFAYFRRKNSNYRLKIAGFGDVNFISRLSCLAKRLDCLDAVEFVGFHKDMRNLMSHAKALIVASRFEGFGRMTAEAAFMGCLVIGRNTGGTKEIIDKTGGFLFSSVEELAEEMERLSSIEDSTYLALAQKAQSVAKQAYSTENNAAQILSIYKKLLRR